MKTAIYFKAVVVIVLCAILLPTGAWATAYYWDNDGTTAGFGTANGVWENPTPGGTIGWSTSSTGVAAPGSITTLISDTVNFGSTTAGLLAGTITVSGTVTNGGMTFASGSGAITLNGGTITNASPLTITCNNTAYTNVIGSSLAGAAFEKAGAGALTLSGVNTINGAITVAAGILNLNNSSLQTFSGVVTLRTATLNINGSNTLNNQLSVAGGAYTGEVNVVNGGILTTRNKVFIGQNNSAAIGTLNIFSNGTVISENYTFIIGNAFDNITAKGILNMETGSVFTVNPAAGTTLCIANGSTTTGTLNLNGGLLTTSRNITSGATASPGNSIINFNGATLKAGAAFTMSGLTRANVRNGGAIIDSTGGTVTMTQALLHSDITDDAATDGGLTKLGTGTLILSGTNTYTGATVAQAGVLELSRTNALSSATALDIRSGAEVRLSFTGTNVVYSLTVNGITKSRGVYAAGSVAGLTGTAGAYLQTLQPPPRGTMVRFF